MRKLIAAIAVLGVFLVSSDAFAAKSKPKVKEDTLKCKKVIDIRTLPNVLYKDSNIHGGRGRTWIDSEGRLGRARLLTIAKIVKGKKNKKTGKRTRTKYVKVGCFGLFACDAPYGCRYYQAMCKDPISNSELERRTNTRGTNNMAVVGNGNGQTCYSFDASASRYGNI